MPPAPAIVERMARLADPLRLRLLRLLERQELTVSELCAVVQAPQSTVSRHLKVLADDRWIDSRRQGTRTLYRFARDGIGSGATMKLWTLLRAELAEAPSVRADDRRLERVLAERRSRSQAFFGSAAGQWDRLREELFGKRFDLAALAALMEEHWTVGDLGCGTGQFAAAVAPFVGQVVAVDDSPAMLKAARQRLRPYPNVRLLRGQLTALPLEDGQLDLAICSLVLHHLPDPPAALEQVHRVLRRDGRLMLVDMVRHDRQEYRQSMGHQWLGFERGELGAWLEGAGFTGWRYRLLPVEPQAKGPGLFVAVAWKKGRRRGR